MLHGLQAQSAAMVRFAFSLIALVAFFLQLLQAQASTTKKTKATGTGTPKKEESTEDPVLVGYMVGLGIGFCIFFALGAYTAWKTVDLRCCGAEKVASKNGAKSAKGKKSTKSKSAK